MEEELLPVVLNLGSLVCRIGHWKEELPRRFSSILGSLLFCFLNCKFCNSSEIRQK